jgi:hypothetical protein
MHPSPLIYNLKISVNVVKAIAFDLQHWGGTDILPRASIVERDSHPLGTRLLIMTALKPFIGFTSQIYKCFIFQCCPVTTSRAVPLTHTVEIFSPLNRPQSFVNMMIILSKFESVSNRPTRQGLLSLSILWWYLRRCKEMIVLSTRKQLYSRAVTIHHNAIRSF